MPAKDIVNPEFNGAAEHGPSNEDEKSFKEILEKLQAQVERLEVDNKSLKKRHRRYSSSTNSEPSDDDLESVMEVRPSGLPDDETPESDEPNMATKEPKVEIKRRRKVQQKYGGPKIERDDEPGAGNFGEDIRGKETVLTVTREFDKKKHLWRKLVEIASPAFVDMLHKESTYDVDCREVEGLLSIQDPLMALFHNRKVMGRYIEKGGYASDSDKVRQLRQHTKLILDYMRNELAESRILDDLEALQPSGLIDFPNVWLLYSPGTVVYTKVGGEYEAFVVDSADGVQKSTRHKSGVHTYTRLELTCWSINYDGEAFGRIWTSHEIFPFKGSKEITSLDLVPEKFMPEFEKVKSSLKARGQQFWALQGQNFLEYTGEIWSQHMTTAATRVMVDRLTWQRRHDWPVSLDKKTGPANAASKNWREDRFNHCRSSSPPPIYDDKRNGRQGRPSARKSRHYADDGYQVRSYSPDGDCEEDKRYEGLYTRSDCERPPLKSDSKHKQYDLLQPDSQPDDLTLLLCPQQVHGYCFRDKIWKALNVTQLKPVTFRKNAWNRLVLDEESKDIVQAMVASYTEKTANLEDLVAGKGAGLVALLHGPPGTGKTLTAECVAESFEKPLYQVTSGDIGTDPSELEGKLDEIFDYATTWGAILLLDEADVFLQERDYVHLERNALVSIFLRTLEYFNGILFLTTNRIGTFDQAFQSRVHVTLGLPPLDSTRRADVWDIFLDDLLHKSVISPDQHTNLQTLVREKWSREPLNGRQIRNAVRTAMLVAERKKQMPGQQHFETVLKIGRDFELYLSALQGVDGEGLAERRGNRLAGDRMAIMHGFQEVEKP